MDREGGNKEKIKAHISPHRHYRRWCTFFKSVYFFASKTQNLGLFGQYGYFVANLCTFWYTFTGQNNAVVYQCGQI